MGCSLHVRSVRGFHHLSRAEGGFDVEANELRHFEHGGSNQWIFIWIARCGCIPSPSTRASTNGRSTRSTRRARKSGSIKSHGNGRCISPQRRACFPTASTSDRVVKRKESIGVRL